LMRIMSDEIKVLAYSLPHPEFAKKLYEYGFSNSATLSIIANISVAVVMISLVTYIFFHNPKRKSDFN
jgi:hypothetical protein